MGLDVGVGVAAMTKAIVGSAAYSDLRTVPDFSVLFESELVIGRREFVDDKQTIEKNKIVIADLIAELERTKAELATARKAVRSRNETIERQAAEITAQAEQLARHMATIISLRMQIEEMEEGR